MKVTHILKDGTRMDSMKGYTIPYRDDTKKIYRAIAKAEMATRDKEQSV
ncbi:BOW99_gp33 family protein [Leuconostoc gelidum]|nr:hypothetical protein [Leuconostoc gelidum]